MLRPKVRAGAFAPVHLHQKGSPPNPARNKAYPGERSSLRGGGLEGVGGVVQKSCRSDKLTLPHPTKDSIS